MRLRRLSARARLTALYTALVAVCGGILVTTTYLLVSRNLQTGVLSTTNAEAPLAFMQKCSAGRGAQPPDRCGHQSEVRFAVRARG